MLACPRPSDRDVALIVALLALLCLCLAGLFGGCAAGSGKGTSDGPASSSTSSSSSAGTGATAGTGGGGHSSTSSGTGGSAGSGTGGGTGGTGGSAGSGTGGTGGSPIPLCGYTGPLCVIAAWDFDSGCPAGWITGGTGSDWGCGQATWGPTGDADCTPTGNVWATGLHGNAATCQSSYLTSPAVDLTAYQGQSVVLGFHHWYDFRECAVPSLCMLTSWMSYSGGRIEVNAGSGWTSVTPMGGYESGGKTVECSSNQGGSPPCGGSSCDVDGDTAAYTCGGLEQQWHGALVDISSYTSSPSFQARFVFGSGEDDPILFQNRPGWYIDNVVIFVPTACP